MEEQLAPERKEKLKRLVEAVVDEDALTNLDARMIIEILLNACERKKSELYEDMVKEMIECDDTE